VRQRSSSHPVCRAAADTLAALCYAKAQAQKIIAVVNQPQGSIAREAEKRPVPQPRSMTSDIVASVDVSR
jgi:hypothetical protein